MKTYKECRKKIIFPVKASYKYDGIFCIIKDNRPFSKDGKEFVCLPDINFPNGTEGELYCHSMKFEDIIGAVKRNHPNSNTSKIEFYPHNLIPKFNIENEKDLFLKMEKAIVAGYEGLVLDTCIGKVKVKPVYDKEYVVLDVVEGRGKLRGKAGKLKFDKFSAGILGSHSYLTSLWEHKEEIIGKLATVQYQNETSNGIPRFPKVKCIRDYEC